MSIKQHCTEDPDGGWLDGITYEHIPDERLITVDGYCFDIESLYEWVITRGNETHPYTKQPISEDTIKLLMDYEPKVTVTVHFVSNGVTILTIVVPKTIMIGQLVYEFHSKFYEYAHLLHLIFSTDATTYFHEIDMTKTLASLLPVTKYELAIQIHSSIQNPSPLIEYTLAEAYKEYGRRANFEPIINRLPDDYNIPYPKQDVANTNTGDINKLAKLFDTNFSEFVEEVILSKMTYEQAIAFKTDDIAALHLLYSRVTDKWRLDTLDSIQRQYIMRRYERPTYNLTRSGIKIVSDVLFPYVVTNVSDDVEIRLPSEFLIMPRDVSPVPIRSISTTSAPIRSTRTLPRRDETRMDRTSRILDFSTREPLGPKKLYLSLRQRPGMIMDVSNWTGDRNISTGIVVKSGHKRGLPITYDGTSGGRERMLKLVNILLEDDNIPDRDELLILRRRLSE